METRQVDAFFFVVALTDLARAVEFAKAKMKDRSLRDPLRIYYGTFGNNLVQAGDARRHFDAWRSGLGDGQVRRDDGSWIFSHGISAQFIGGGRRVRIVIRLDAKRVLNISDVNNAVAAAGALANAAQSAIRAYVARHASQGTT